MGVGTGCNYWSRFWLLNVKQLDTNVLHLVTNKKTAVVAVPVVLVVETAVFVVVVVVIVVVVVVLVVIVVNLVFVVVIVVNVVVVAVIVVMCVLYLYETCQTWMRVQTCSWGSSVDPAGWEEESACRDSHTWTHILMKTPDDGQVDSLTCTWGQTPSSHSNPR